MRYAPILIIAAGCSGDVNFSANPDPNTNLDGTATMELSMQAMEWADLEVGKSKSQTLVITSTGENPLKLDSAIPMGADAQSFYVQEAEHTDIQLVTGQQHEITVVCTLDALEEVSGYLRLDTNDSEIPVRDIPLHGTPLGWTGDTDPIDTDEDDTDGGM